MTDEPPPATFPALLRMLRAGARLTQEELAAAASLSPRSISDLERGVSRTARKETALLLADALAITGPAHQAFVAAARGKAPVSEVLAAMDGGPVLPDASPGRLSGGVTTAAIPAVTGIWFVGLTTVVTGAEPACRCQSARVDLALRPLGQALERALAEVITRPVGTRVIALDDGTAHPPPRDPAGDDG
jgi:transcriptional regulator with XRE-family HTH domain